MQKLNYVFIVAAVIMALISGASFFSYSHPSSLLKLGPVNYLANRPVPWHHKWAGNKDEDTSLSLELKISFPKIGREGTILQTGAAGRGFELLYVPEGKLWIRCPTNSSDGYIFKEIASGLATGNWHVVRLSVQRFGRITSKVDGRITLDLCDPALHLTVSDITVGGEGKGRFTGNVSDCIIRAAGFSKSGIIKSLDNFSKYFSWAVWIILIIFPLSWAWNRILKWLRKGYLLEASKMVALGLPFFAVFLLFDHFPAFFYSAGKIAQFAVVPLIAVFSGILAGFIRRKKESFNKVGGALAVLGFCAAALAGTNLFINSQSLKFGPISSDKTRHFFEKTIDCPSGIKDTMISFKMNAENAANHGNIFQTANEYKGIRVEMIEPASAVLFLGNRGEKNLQAIPLKNYVTFGEFHDVVIRINPKGRVEGFFDKEKTIDAYIPWSDYDVSRILVGAGFDDKHIFNGKIKDFQMNISCKTIPFWLLLGLALFSAEMIWFLLENNYFVFFKKTKRRMA